MSSNALRSPAPPDTPAPSAAQARSTLAQRASRWMDDHVFNALYSRSLIYNTCWEDPEVDKQVLRLGPDERVLMLTSAGCNALDYAASGAGSVVAVDANPRQSALLELKIAGIRELDHATFFQIFGEGRHPAFRSVYEKHLRLHLSDFARQFWDQHSHWFTHKHPGRTLYGHGLTGLFGRAARAYVRRRQGLGGAIDAMVQAADLDTQRQIYLHEVKPRLWHPALKWALSRQVTMSLLGVPHSQRLEVEQGHSGGIAGFIEASIDHVCGELPLKHNHFWRLYLQGHYTRDCCPTYLTPSGFEILKAGAVQRIEVHTATLTDHLRRDARPVSRLVLLDHMDWMSNAMPEALAEEWHWLLRRATPGAIALFRSAHPRPRFLDQVQVDYAGQQRPLRAWMQLDAPLAEALTRQDRVHTYAGFHIATLAH